MATALGSESFVAFELSPEPEPIPQPPQASSSTSQAHALSPSAPNSARGPTPSTKGKETEFRGGKFAQKRSREEREREEREQRDPNDPEAYRNKKEQDSARSRATPWTEGMDWEACRNPAEMLNREILAFVNYISPSPTEHATRTHIVALIRKAVVTQWPDAKVMPFGSFETGLYLPTGDIDLVIQSDSMDRQNKVTVLHTLASVLRRANLAESIQVIAKAKVPIVKFVSAFGRLPIDISLNQLNGISAGKIVNSYIAALPALKPLVLVIKAFLSQRGMNEVYSGGLGSYSVICLVVSFLQIHPKIRRAEIDPMQNLGVLLIEIFELYGKHFGYDETGITLRDGGTYFSKVDRGWQNERQKYLLSIEDPQDPTNDISRSSYGIIRVRSTFAGAYEVLTSRLYIRAAEIVSRRSGRHGRLSIGRGDDGAMSILIGIMGVSPEVRSTLNLPKERLEPSLRRVADLHLPFPLLNSQVSKHRVLLYDLHRSGTLQNMLGIPLELVASNLPAFTQSLPTPSSSTRHKRFSRSPSPPARGGSSSRRSRSPPSIAQPKRSLGAIHVEDDSGSDRRQGASGVRREDGYYSSDSEVSFIEQPFKDKPFVPSSKRSSGAASLPPKPSTTAASSSSSLAVPSTSTKRSSSSRKSPSPAPLPRRSASPDDSRYSVGQTPAAKRLRRSRQHSYSPAPHSTKEDAVVISDSDDSSSEEGQVKEIYIEGQDELLPTDEDEEDELSEIYGGKGKAKPPVAAAKKTVLEQEDEEDEEEGKGKSQRKADRRKAREAKRAFWSGKSGTSGRMEGGRYGGMESD
ncbi:hypothetical protein BDY24DRAFT_378617 [Mrakia frigida]|uniref:uncharacterized protein n=1 Tax=Mrakia frigida TaxID=29902 RepID=UPI003FCC1CFF